MMRTLSLFVVLLSGLAGAWLFTRGEFYLPNRFNLSLATHFSGMSARLLAGALLCLSAAGLSFMQRMAMGTRAGADRAWQIRHFVILSLCIVLFTAAFIKSEVVLNPDYRAPSHSTAQTD
ncbi:MAG TPA: hypothetical protein PK620_12375 [Denitromonas sp.]|uniref:hypothetical protein n=1 Tax=Denitromonas sp. TaxID=2734609 RepID=UPI001D4AB93E|nr:hypothetical protein [Rhodocyclaceae bacterium]MCP5222505.1 hypothetical protein [Zoogloeaceae bacterium]HQU89570.1 hypothetical protein [Denitromonas sp.]HQV15705.1 hypothetical protein [Denitromonas sp.]